MKIGTDWRLEFLLWHIQSCIFFFLCQLDLLIRIKISWTFPFDWFMKCLICAAPVQNARFNLCVCINHIDESSLRHFQVRNFRFTLIYGGYVLFSCPFQTIRFVETCEKLIMRIFAIAPLLLLFGVWVFDKGDRPNFDATKRAILPLK